MNIITTTFEKKEKFPIYLQLFKKLKEDISKGYLKKGDKLPSIRAAMKLFSLSKTSVESAYEKLVSEGLVIAYAHKGYYVDVTKEEIMKRDFILEEKVEETSLYQYDLTSNSIDANSFDVPLWKRYIKEVMENKKELATYGDVQGELSLRKALQKYAYTQRGVVCDVEQIIVGANYQSLLYLLCSLLPFSEVALEEDSFMQAIQVFKDMKYSITYLKRCKEDISLEALHKSKANLLYVQSSACGKYRTQIKQGRKSLLTWCDTTHYLIEDDHNGELRYISKVQPALQGFDTKGSIIYIGSFSKTLLPSLRIAYMILPPSLLTLYKEKKDNYSSNTSKIEQLALASYIAQGNLDRHIKRVRKQYEKKSKMMLVLLEKYFKNAHIYLEEASFQYVVEFPKGFIDNISRHLQKEKILMNCKKDTLYISFSSIKEEEMEYVIQRIDTCIQKKVGKLDE